MIKHISISIWLFIISSWISPFLAEGAEYPISDRIQVNQLGYLPASPKIAVVSSSIGLPFYVTGVSSDKPLLKGMLKLVEAHDKASGANLWIADFSVLEATGLYSITVPGIGRSYPFSIDRHLYAPVSKAALKSFYHHRCGTALSDTFAGVWARGVCDSSDAEIYSASPGEGMILSATGGWHDGSDNGKYAVTGIYAAALLLQLYEIKPHSFPDRSLDIPESGNGVPDGLDEIRWEIEWLLKMQDESGGVHHKLTALVPNEPNDPSKNTEKRFVFPISTAATAGACALFSKAYRLYAAYDIAFASRCLNAAETAWQFLDRNPPDGGFQNPAGVQTKTYNDGDDSDERFWAAIELFLSTHKPIFQEHAREIAKNRVPLFAASGFWGNVMPLTVASILCVPDEAIPPDLRKEIVSDLLSLADTLLDKIERDGYRLSIREGDFSWGSNAAVLQNTVVLYLANRIEPKKTYGTAAMDQLHYILGRNPLSMCFVTGFGARSPLNPYHSSITLNNEKKPITGLLVGGSNQLLNDSILKRSFLKNTAPALTYIDSNESFASNETIIDWNAVLVFVINVLADDI